MPTFFQTAPGQVAALPDSGGVVGMPLAVDGIGGSWFPAFRSVLTGASVALDGNFQALQTLRDLIHVYTFGDRMSGLQVTGLSFTGDCQPGTPSGLELVLAYYRANRIAARSSPVQIALGTTPAGRFTGFLVGARAELSRPEVSLASFTLLFQIFPGQ